MCDRSLRDEVMPVVREKLRRGGVHSNDDDDECGLILAAKRIGSSGHFCWRPTKQFHSTFRESRKISAHKLLQAISDNTAIALKDYY